MAQAGGSSSQDSTKNNETGFQADTDLYSILNLPQTATSKEIESRFRRMAVSLHPDKFRRLVRRGEADDLDPIVESDEVLSEQISQVEQEFVQVKLAYGYLTDPITRTIYDEFGVPGLTVFEKNRSNFIELQNELRSLNNPGSGNNEGQVNAGQPAGGQADQRTEEQQRNDRQAIQLIQEAMVQDEKDKKRHEIEQKVVQNCRDLMQRTVKVQMINKYSKIFFAELAISATDFLNNLKYIFASNNIGQAMQMIRRKHFVGLGQITIPWPTEHDKKHSIQLALQTQNDLKKNQGFQLLKLTDSYHWSDICALKNVLTLKSHQWSYQFQMQRYFCDKKLWCKFANEVSANWGKREETSFINPSFSFSDKQLSPYVVSGGFNGGLNLSIQRDISPSNPYGYSFGFDLNPDKLTLNPSLWYQITDGVKCFTTLAIDSDFGLRANVGAEYEFSQETKFTVQYQETIEELTKLVETFVVLQLTHQGYVLKMPIYGHTNDNPRGKALTLSLFALGNFAAYRALKHKLAHEPILKSTKYQVAYTSYCKQVEKLTAKVRENYFWLETNLNREARSNGLIIFEAYYGLDEHIYQVDAGLKTFTFPQSVEEYNEAQLVPLKKLLTIKIANSQLVVNRTEFKRAAARTAIFNPCINKAARTLLYLRYSFRGLEKVLIYDFSQENLVVPHDIQ